MENRTVNKYNYLTGAQAKKMCEELPKVIKEKVPKAEAEKIKEELTANGGVVELV